MASYAVKILFILSISFGMFSLAFSQEKSDLFDTIPESQRGTIHTRLQQFVEYHRTEQWEKVFDFFSEQYKKSGVTELKKDEFLKNKLYGEVNMFSPKAIYESPNGEAGAWWIEGCATYSDGSKNEAVIIAYFENENWFFSDIWATFDCIGCKPKKCKH